VVGARVDGVVVDFVVVEGARDVEGGNVDTLPAAQVAQQCCFRYISEQSDNWHPSILSPYSQPFGASGKSLHL